MKYSRRILAVLIVPLALAGLWLTFGDEPLVPRADAEQAAGEAQVQAHLQQAADSIIAAAKQSVQAANTDEESARRMQISIEALRLIGNLGEFDTAAQTDKLLDDLQAIARPSLQEMIVQVRLSSRLQRWNELDPAERAKTIDQFVADVKRAGLSKELAALFMRVTDMLERFGDYKLAANAINELLPVFEASQDPQVAGRAPLLKGVVRRLPGNKIELEGSLLGGGELDWESFRGKVVLVDFFASWCGPCRAEVPNVLANYNAYKDKGFEVVGVNMDNQRQAAESYVQQAGFHFPTLFSDDPENTGWDHPMGRKYGVTALPRVILVDEKGVIVSTMARGQNLDVLLRDLLGPPSTPSGESTSTTELDSDVAPASFEEEAAPAVREN